jgi:hypothetical protein
VVPTRRATVHNCAKGQPHRVELCLNSATGLGRSLFSFPSAFLLLVLSDEGFPTASHNRSLSIDLKVERGERMDDF